MMRLMDGNEKMELLRQIVQSTRAIYLFWWTLWAKALVYFVIMCPQHTKKCFIPVGWNIRSRCYHSGFVSAYDSGKTFVTSTIPFFRGISTASRYGEMNFTVFVWVLPYWMLPMEMRKENNYVTPERYISYQINFWSECRQYDHKFLSFLVREFSFYHYYYIS